MNAPLIFGSILLGLGALLFIGALVFSFLKHLKNTRFPEWKFLDYISVGYADHLFKKYVKKV